MSTQLPLALSQSMTDWKKGPPPSEGWWPASRYRDLKVRRFYKLGKGWSLAVFVGQHQPDFKDLRFISDIMPGFDAASSSIEWCGLTAPHPDGYSYPLTPVFEEAPL